MYIERWGEFVLSPPRSPKGIVRRELSEAQGSRTKSEQHYTNHGSKNSRLQDRKIRIKPQIRRIEECGWSGSEA